VVPAAVALIAAAALLVARDGDDANRPPTERGASVVWAVGDGGDGLAEAREVADLIEAGDPDRVIYLGDVYETGTAEEFEANFALVYRDLLAIIEPTPGNHEWPRHRSGYDPFWEEVKGRPQPHRYAFQTGGWEVISLNSEDLGSPHDPQLDWLEGEIAEGGDCRIAFWHRPRYSAGRHGDEPGVEPFWEILRGRARLVLGGHDHNYQRFAPVGGLIQIVAGAGGREAYEVDEQREGLAASHDEEYGALRLELRPGRADYEYVTADRDVIDRGAVTCDPPGAAAG